MYVHVCLKGLYSGCTGVFLEGFYNICTSALYAASTHFVQVLLQGSTAVVHRF